jgi:hypothetical protein
MPTGRLLAVLATVSGLLALCMLLIHVTVGVNQEWFEVVHPPDMYSAQLLGQATWLRVVFTLDTLFLLAYLTLFIVFGATRPRGAPGALIALFLVCMVTAGLLDALENLHILAMLRAAEAQALPTLGAIEFQEVASAFKFAISYLGAILFALLLPRDTRLSRFLAWSTGTVYPLVGVLALTTLGAWAGAFALARFAFFVGGFFLAALVFWGRKDEQTQAD